MKPPEIFETKRLCLRPPTLEDAEAIFLGYAQDLEVVKYLIWRPHKSIQETRDFLTYCIGEWKKCSNFPYAILKKADGKLIGMVEIGGDGGVGYVLARAHWGQGYMTEAVKMLVDWGRNEKEVPRIWAHCDLENLASAHIMEKVGMRREEILRRHTVHPNISDAPRDMFSYSVTK
jgi:[ribosomal protein S5]-alanine N-acetyltransferase